MSKFFDSMKDYLDKGIEVSKEVLVKAGSSVQDFSDKSVVKIEVKQLELKIKKELASLGLAVYDAFDRDKTAVVSCDDAGVSGRLEEISRLRSEKERLEEKLQDAAKKQ